jgi:hypothetical protein
MAKYISTGKIHFGKTLLGIVLGIAGAVLIGVLYALSMDLIPFIIIDAFVLLGAIAGMIFLAVGIVRLGVIRNTAVKIVVILTICIAAWYTQWAVSTQHDVLKNFLRFDRVFDDIIDWCNNREISISRSFSSSGAGISGIGLYILYSIELLLFLSPTLLVFKFQNDYFCEPCGKFNDNKEFYIRGLNEGYIHSAEQSGDFRFIADPALLPTKEVPPVLGQAWQVDFSHCPNCYQNGVINVYHGIVEMDSKDKKLMFDNKGSVVKHTLVNNMAVADLRGIKLG